MLSSHHLCIVTARRLAGVRLRGSQRFRGGVCTRLHNTFSLGLQHHTGGQQRGLKTEKTIKLEDVSVRKAPLASLEPIEVITKERRSPKAPTMSENPLEHSTSSIGTYLLPFSDVLDIPQKLGRKPKTHEATDEALEDVASPSVLPPLEPIELPQKRGRKSRLSKSLSEKVSETSEPLTPLSLQDEDVPAYPAVMQSVLENMQAYANCVVLTRVGGFYEIYFEHADEFGPQLNLKVAQRKTARGPVSMAGFPFFQLDRYLKILVQDLSRYVAIAEEFPNDASERVKAGGLMHDRRVARIITPGTLIDENFMDPFANNYVLSIHMETFVTQDLAKQSDLPLGLAWLDLSTGHFFTQYTILSHLPSFLARISPREIILDDAFMEFQEHAIFNVLADDSNIITYIKPNKVKEISEWTPMLESAVTSRVASHFTPHEVAAGSAILQYVEQQLLGTNVKLRPPSRQSDSMGIDKNTMRALEIKKTYRDGLIAGSLLHVVRRTTTKGGARLMDSWLSSPSTDINIINSRLDLVTHMLDNETLRSHVTILLGRSHDSHRLLQKFAFGRGDPDDLLALASTVHATRDLVALLAQDSENIGGSDCIEDLLARINLDDLLHLAGKILSSIDEEGLSAQQHASTEEKAEAKAQAQAALLDVEKSAVEPTIKRSMNSKIKGKPTSIREHYSTEDDSFIMKPGATAVLKRLHKCLQDLSCEKEILAEDLCARLGATSLTLRVTPGLGHICHIKGKDINITHEELRSVSSSKSTRSFHHPEWTKLGTRIDQCRAHIKAEEQKVFHDLREMVIGNIVKLRRNATALDELDVACSFAIIAMEKNWVRPTMNKGRLHNVVGGRHPTVEGGLEKEGRTFVTNDCTVGEKTGTGDNQLLWLITGPNMAGKSTFLRQNALITILAQVGSYVPAESAEIGIVDQIFSRVGSADNLYRDQSTFMVEMLETAQILKQATEKSFVIMDEIGRGTTPSDGTAVAFACLHHLYHINRCRTLFATHFHELADIMEGEGMQNVGYYCTDVREYEEGKGFSYVHRLREGINRQSHALKVARLAGLPEEAVAVAKQILARKSI